MLGVLEMLKDIEGARLEPSKHGAGFYVQCLRKTDPLPQFGHGIPDTHFAQKDWIWIAFREEDSKPLALIAASPVHGIVWLVRIYATDLAPQSIMVAMLRKVLADIHLRGYTKYAVHLSDTETENKLARLVVKAGGEKLESGITLYVAPVDISKWGW